MEKIQNSKFQELSVTDLEKINGGKWHIETRVFPQGGTWVCSYRTNIWGETVEWGTPRTDQC